MLRQILYLPATVYLLLWVSCVLLSIAFDRTLGRHAPELARATAARRRGLAGHRWVLRREYRGASRPVERLGAAYRAVMISFYLVFVLAVVGFAAAFIRPDLT